MMWHWSNSSRSRTSNNKYGHSSLTKSFRGGTVGALRSSSPTPCATLQNNKKGMRAYGIAASVLIFITTLIRHQNVVFKHEILRDIVFKSHMVLRISPFLYYSATGTNCAKTQNIKRRQVAMWFIIKAMVYSSRLCVFKCVTTDSNSFNTDTASSFFLHLVFEHPHFLCCFSQTVFKSTNIVKTVQ